MTQKMFEKFKKILKKNKNFLNKIYSNKYAKFFWVEIA
jgi:hypothetical protein